MALRILKLIQEIQRSPFEGTGQPEPLWHDPADCWSRRTNQEHRLVYQVLEPEGRIRVLACRYPYREIRLAGRPYQPPPAG
jgi:toxin YoeB